MRKFSPYGEREKLRRKWMKGEHQFSSLGDPKKAATCSNDIFGKNGTNSPYF
jgi:hypothetical protein